MFRKYVANFRTSFPKNTSAGLLLIFSELLALEIIKSNDVQICQFILIRRNQTCFFPWPYHFYLHNYLTYNSFLRKCRCHIWILKKIEIKVIKKVKES